MGATAVKSKRRPSRARVLKEHLLSEMAEHRIPVGGRLPSESTLMRQFGLSRSTVRLVLAELASGGYVDRQHGRGTFRLAEEKAGGPRARSMLVGVWFNWSTGPLFGPIAEGILEELACWDYHAVFETEGMEHGAERRGILSLIRKDLDGFIIAPAINPGDDHGPLQELIDRRVPVVLVDRPLAEGAVDLVSTNSILGAEQVVEHLVHLGHQRIGFIGISGLSTVEDRLMGYRRTMRRSRLPVDERWVVMNDQVAVDGGREAARALTALPADQRPTAIFAVNDGIAEVVAGELHRLGLGIPEDVSLAGFDDICVDPSRPAWLKLTTYAQPKRELGRQAALLMMKRIEDPQRPPMTVLLEGRLIERTSTRPLGCVPTFPDISGVEGEGGASLREGRSSC